MLARIATKVGIPPADFLEMMVHERPFPTHCLPWTGTTTQGGIVRRRYSCVVARPYPIVFKGTYVHRYLLEILYENPSKAKSLCGNTLCINPLHWHFTTAEPPVIPDTPVDTGWTYEEAEGLVDRYLIFHGWPLNPNHDLLIDIPPALLARFQPNAR